MHRQNSMATLHALTRMAERRIPIEDVLLVLHHSEIRIPDRGDRSQFAMSHKRAMELRRQGIGPRNTRRLERLVVIAEADYSVVTCFHDHH